MVEVFVFGSNEMGVHGAGAAKTALRSHPPQRPSNSAALRCAISRAAAGPYGRDRSSCPSTIRT